MAIHSEKQAVGWYKPSLGLSVEETGEPSFPRVDYDVHGLVGVRLLNAKADDSAAVKRQLGLAQTSLAREPDITIRFVDRLATSSPLCYLGWEDAAFTDDAFVILRAKHKTHTKVQIPFEQIGQHCEIVCERGLPAVPLLVPILNLTALSKGAVPMHASAFNYNGKGILTTGWSKGGKTEALLSFVANGAEYIGDEWVYLSGNGQYIYGLPEPVRAWDWHLKELPELRALVSRSDRARMRALRLLIQLIERMASSRLGRRLTFVKLLSRSTWLLKQQLCVDVPPKKFFGQRVGPSIGTAEKIFFMVSHEASDITVRPIDPQQIVQRMVFSLQEERASLMSYYLKFRFAFPGRRNELIDDAEERQREILQRIWAGKEAYAVHHPYPVSVPALFEAMAPVV